jgi:hypothetical protein
LKKLIVTPALGLFVASARLRRRRSCRHPLALVLAIFTAGAGLLAVLLACAPLASATTVAYYPALRFGDASTFGSAGPTGIAVDSQGNIYCCDPNYYTGQRVEKFTSAGVPVCSIGDTGLPAQRLHGTYDLAVTPDGLTVYVMDSYGDRVVVYSSADGLSYAWANEWPIPPSGGGTNRAHGIGLDGSGHVFVADTPHDQVLEYSTSGSLLSTIGSSGSGTAQLSYPQDVAADSSGDIFVADNANSRVVEWHYSAATWSYQATIATGASHGAGAQCLAIDGAGHVYWTQMSPQYVCRWDPSVPGSVYTYGTGASVDGSDAGFHFPWGVAVSADGNRIYVGDTDNEVHVLAQDTTAPITTLTGADGLWHSGSVPLTLGAVDTGGSGMSGGSAKTEYQIDAGDWTAGTSLTVSGDGTHTVGYRSTDAVGNTETAKNATVKIDGSTPTISVSGLPSGWSRFPVSLSFSAVGGPSGAVAQYQRDGGAWTAAAALTISASGSHDLAYRALSGAGIFSATATATVKIDTIGPATSAKAAKGRKGKALTLKYLVSDNLSPRATGVTLTIKNAKHKLVRSFALGTKNVATWYTVKWTPKAKGAYSYAVTAKDLAGNPQVKAGSGKITVK